MKQEISREDVKTIIERELKRKEYEKSMNEGVFDVFKSKKRKEALRELEGVVAFLNNALLDIFTQPYKYQESPSAPNRGREMKSKIDGRKVKMDRIYSKGAVPGRISGDDSYMMLQNWVEINRKNKTIQVLEDRLRKLIQDYEDDPRKSYHPLHVTPELKSLNRYAALLLQLDSGSGARPYTRKYEEGIKVTKNQLKNMIEEELALKELGRSSDRLKAELQAQIDKFKKLVRQQALDRGAYRAPKIEINQAPPSGRGLEYLLKNDPEFKNYALSKAEQIILKNIASLYQSSDDEGKEFIKSELTSANNQMTPRPAYDGDEHFYGYDDQNYKYGVDSRVKMTQKKKMPPLAKPKAKKSSDIPSRRRRSRGSSRMAKAFSLSESKLTKAEKSKKKKLEKELEDLKHK